MVGLKKIILQPYFGPFPEWMDKFELPKGFDWLLDTDLEKFKQRVRDKLGIEYPGTYGSGKLHDYRGALGLLYEDEIKGFDFWGFTDFDCVYGDMDKWFPDEQLNELDIWSNHDTYICGCWTLMRNCGRVNRLFSEHPNWKENMSSPEVNGWIEDGYSRLVESSGLRYKYSFFQGDPYTPPFNLIKEKGRLYQSVEKGQWEEIPMLHFRRHKHWPL